MRALLGFSLFALMTAGAAGVCARAETYPTRPVTFVVPFAPGGGTEFLAQTEITRWGKVVEQAGIAGSQ